MKHKQYNIRSPYKGQATEHTARLSRDMDIEVARTVDTMKQIGNIVRAWRTDPSYRIYKELEMLNQRLEDIVTEWGE